MGAQKAGATWVRDAIVRTPVRVFRVKQGLIEGMAKKRVGRPSLYKPEFAELARKFCCLGATDADLARFLEVSEATINTWKLEHPEFLESIKAGKAQADAEVASKLFHRATGYEHPEDDIRTVSMGDGAGSEIVITPTVKHYPPDTTAAIFWLKNRRPDLWRDKVHQEISVDQTLAERLARARERAD